MTLSRAINRAAAGDSGFFRMGLSAGPRDSFDPRSLFADGSLGQWIDPYDPTTLFQDNLGATPVTASAQTTGLAMDKSRGRTLGSELISNGSFASAGSGWSLLGTGNTTTFTGGAAQIQGTTAPGLRRSGVLTIGKIYQVSFRVRRLAGTGTLFVAPFVPLPTIGSEWLTLTAIRGASTTNFDIGLAGTATGNILEVTDISVKEVLGNHAVQSTAGSRPSYRSAPNRIDYDGVDDSLATTFVDLGANCTIVRSVPGVGTSILTGQTIGAGTRSDSADHCGLLIINRPLTAGETAAITAVFNARAGV